MNKETLALQIYLDLDPKFVKLSSTNLRLNFPFDFINRSRSIELNDLVAKTEDLLVCSNLQRIIDPPLESLDLDLDPKLDKI